MKNVCIVGYGAIGPIHAKALSEIESAKLYAVCDIDSDAIDRCRADYDVAGYSDYDAMLRDTNIHAVHICTPHYLHFEMIKKALEHGKQVVCEKPVTMTQAEFNELLTLDGSENVCVVMQNRHNTCVKKLKELISGGDLGELAAIKGMVTWLRTADYYVNGSWRGKWATEGGGVLINQSVHTLDLLIHLAGDVASVEASMANHSLKNVIEVEDTVDAYLKFKTGISGLFYATNTYPGGVDIEVVGSNAIARYTDSKLIINGQAVAEDTAPDGGKSYWGSGHMLLLRDFYENNKFYSPHDIINTMNTLFGIYESAKAGKEIKTL